MGEIIYSLDPWTWAAIGAGLIILLVSLAAVWIWRGVWLAQHRGQMYARSRWHWYVRAERRHRKWKARRAQAAGKAPPSVTLEIQKAEHKQRAVITEQIEKARVRHNG